MKDQRKIPDGDKKNFKTLQEAFANKDVAILRAKRKADGKYVTLLCAVGFDGEFYNFSPFATMNEGNPFEDFEKPFQETGE